MGGEYLLEGRWCVYRLVPVDASSARLWVGLALRA